jgi:cardiolipin synthase
MPRLQPGHQVTLLQGGQEFFPALVQAIDQGVHEVRLETYIFEFDASGQQVADALLRAAGRGLDVYLVMDGAGTSTIPTDWAARFDAAGVRWHIFSPLGRLSFLYLSSWRRMHRKLCVVDGRVAFCGGINVLDDFQDPNHGTLSEPRFDFAVRMTGPLVQSVYEVMVQFWWRQQIAQGTRKMNFKAAWRALRKAVRLKLKKGGMEDPPAMRGNGRQDESPGHGAKAALLLRDNVLHRSRIEQAYLKAIGEARHDIIIANAYFLPGRKLRQALIHAARRGIRMRLLLQGRYEYFMPYHAARPVYGVLLAAGVEIYEYAPSFLHAKVAVIDSQWATVGSSNLDPLSLLLAREANVVVNDAVFAQALRLRLVHAMEFEGQRVDPASCANRPWRQRLLDRAAFGLMRLALFLIGKRY